MSTAPSVHPTNSVVGLTPTDPTSPLVYSELLDPQGAVRPHWQQFLQTIPDPKAEEFTHRWQEAQGLIRENGVTYNVAGDSAGFARPWQLDPLPFILSQTEAQKIELALIQRAKLLELLLADLYGPQQTIRDGLIPPELIYRNPGYLRSCHGIPVPNQRYLHLYAANLGRGLDGNWLVLGDRTQAPTGIGYVLENRIVISRTLPEAFQQCSVQRLAPFYQKLIESLRSIAHRNKDNPRVVLLTAGPSDETYFEHSYLARYLGYTLAESADLTVRDKRVYLKVLGGLQPVDVIFRKIEDDLCDPLELRADSIHGVPGLVQAVRAGNVSIANALGSGLMEMPALLIYLPQLCRTLLKQDLLMPSIPTWWCGDPVQRDHVLNHLDRMVIKPAFSSVRRDRLFFEEAEIDPAEWRARILANPHAYVGQEKLAVSQFPALTSPTPSQYSIHYRAYLTMDGESHRMMPGGLTRIGLEQNKPAMSHNLVGSKDTWILSTSPVAAVSLLPQNTDAVVLTRGGGDLPSRSADNLFWLGRYAERVEHICRVLRDVISRSMERTDPLDFVDLSRLVLTLHPRPTPNSTPIEIPAGAQEPLEQQIWKLIFSQEHSYSLYSVSHLWHRVAATVRDRISQDMWRVVSAVQRKTADPNKTSFTQTPSDLLELLDRILLHLIGFAGLVAENMSRGEGWRFLDMGRKLERSENLLRLVSDTLIVPCEQENRLLDSLLQINDSRMTYRRRYLAQLKIESVLDLVLLDDLNPRSLLSQVQALQTNIHQLPRKANAPIRPEEQRLSLTALYQLQLADIFSLCQVHEFKRSGLANFSEELQTLLPELSDVLTQHYLSHLQTTRHLAPSTPRGT